MSSLLVYFLGHEYHSFSDNQIEFHFNKIFNTKRKNNNQALALGLIYFFPCAYLQNDYLITYKIIYLWTFQIYILMIVSESKLLSMCILFKEKKIRFSWKHVSICWKQDCIAYFPILAYNSVYILALDVNWLPGPIWLTILIHWKIW